MISPRDTLNLMSDMLDDVKKNKYLAMAAYRINANLLVNMKFNKSSFGVDIDNPETRQAYKEEAQRLAIGPAAILYSGEAQAYYCSEEMSAVVDQAAKVLDASDICDVTLCPSMMGFCYFAGGLRVSEDMIIHTLMWCPSPGVPDQLLIYGFNDQLTEPDGSAVSWARQADELELDTRWIFRFTQGYNNGSTLRPADFSQTSEQIVKQGLGTQLLMHDPKAFLHALFLMLNQHVTVVEKTKVEATKKKAARLAVKKLPTDITVINLRYARNESSSEVDPVNGSRVDYSHRWVVNGFWRNQHYKEVKGGEYKYKRIWIHAYIKGPSDKPLHVTEKVYALIK